jgi:RNA polymerase-binding transcription factor DksA
MIDRNKLVVGTDTLSNWSRIAFSSDAEQQLLLEKKQLLAKINSEPRFYEAPIAGEQESDYPTEVEIREIEFSQIERHHLRLREINEALERIDNGLFGYCEDCGAIISENRLIADPAVTRCYGCQVIAERGFKTPSL